MNNPFAGMPGLDEEAPVSGADPFAGMPGLDEAVSPKPEDPATKFNAMMSDPNGRARLQKLAEDFGTTPDDPKFIQRVTSPLGFRTYTALNQLKTTGDPDEAATLDADGKPTGLGLMAAVVQFGHAGGVFRRRRDAEISRIAADQPLEVGDITRSPKDRAKLAPLSEQEKVDAQQLHSIRQYKKIEDMTRAEQDATVPKELLDLVNQYDAPDAPLDSKSRAQAIYAAAKTGAMSREQTKRSAAEELALREELTGKSDGILNTLGSLAAKGMPTVGYGNTFLVGGAAGPAGAFALATAVSGADKTSELLSADIDPDTGEATKQGADYGTARTRGYAYGAFESATEIATGKVLGAIFKGADKITGGYVGKALSKGADEAARQMAKTSVGRGIAELAKGVQRIAGLSALENPAIEALEEGIQQWDAKVFAQRPSDTETPVYAKNVLNEATGEMEQVEVEPGSDEERTAKRMLARYGDKSGYAEVGTRQMMIGEKTKKFGKEFFTWANMTALAEGFALQYALTLGMGTLHAVKSKEARSIIDHELLAAGFTNADMIRMTDEQKAEAFDGFYGSEANRDKFAEVFKDAGQMLSESAQRAVDSDKWMRTGAGIKPNFTSDLKKETEGGAMRVDDEESGLSVDYSSTLEGTAFTVTDRDGMLSPVTVNTVEEAQVAAERMSQMKQGRQLDMAKRAEVAAQVAQVFAPGRNLILVQNDADMERAAAEEGSDPAQYQAGSRGLTTANGSLIVNVAAATSFDDLVKTIKHETGHSVADEAGFTALMKGKSVGALVPELQKAGIVPRGATAAADFLADVEKVRAKYATQGVKLADADAVAETLSVMQERMEPVMRKKFGDGLVKMFSKKGVGAENMKDARRIAAGIMYGGQATEVSLYGGKDAWNPPKPAFTGDPIAAGGVEQAPEAAGAAATPAPATETPPAAEPVVEAPAAPAEAEAPVTPPAEVEAPAAVNPEVKPEAPAPAPKQKKIFKSEEEMAAYVEANQDEAAGWTEDDFEIVPTPEPAQSGKPAIAATPDAGRGEAVAPPTEAPPLNLEGGTPAEIEAEKAKVEAQRKKQEERDEIAKKAAAPLKGDLGDSTPPLPGMEGVAPDDLELLNRPPQEKPAEPPQPAAPTPARMSAEVEFEAVPEKGQYVELPGVTVNGKRTYLIQGKWGNGQMFHVSTAHHGKVMNGMAAVLRTKGQADRISGVRIVGGGAMPAGSGNWTVKQWEAYNQEVLKGGAKVETPAPKAEAAPVEPPKVEPPPPAPVKQKKVFKSEEEMARYVEANPEALNWTEEDFEIVPSETAPADEAAPAPEAPAAPAEEVFTPPKVKIGENKLAYNRRVAAARKEWEAARPAKTPAQDEVRKAMTALTPPKPDAPVFDSDYTGPRFTYGLRNRPLQIGAQPKGFIIGSQRPSEQFKAFGTIQYPRQLTDKEVYDFELVPVLDAKDSEEEAEMQANRETSARVDAIPDDVYIDNPALAVMDVELPAYEARKAASTRTADSKERQAYSTPPPLAAIGAAALAGAGGGNADTVTVIEPTAGNGGLIAVLGLSEGDKVLANELDEGRAKRLRETFLDVTVTQGDYAAEAYQKAVADAAKDGPRAFLMNPPFGPTDESGYKLEHRIALKTIESAVTGDTLFFIGAAPGRDAMKMLPGALAGAYTSGAHAKFHQELNRRGWKASLHFIADGALYRKMGASFPVEVLLMEKTDGKETNTHMPMRDLPGRYATWEQIRAAVAEMYDPGAKTVGERAADTLGLFGKAEQARAEATANAEASSPEITGARVKESGGIRYRLSQDIELGLVTPETGLAVSPVMVKAVYGKVWAKEFAGIVHNPTQLAERILALPPEIAENRIKMADAIVAYLEANVENRFHTDLDYVSMGPALREAFSARWNAARASDMEEEGGRAQVEYSPLSTKEVASPMKMPIELAGGIATALNDFADRHPEGIDAFVAEKMGWTMEQTTDGRLDGSQIDALGLAIEKIDEGTGMIVGSQTGAGKGRVMAAVMAYHRKLGRVPIFLTAQAKLFTDIWRDLTATGGADGIKPLVMNDYKAPKSEDPDSDDEDAFTMPVFFTPVQRGSALSEGRLPQGANAIFLTYSQVQNPTESTRRKIDLIKKLLASGKGALVMDEAHLAAGADSNRGAVLREFADLAKPGVVFSSATFAKRGENMTLYKRAGYSQFFKDDQEMEQALLVGGVPFQQYLAARLTERGFYIRHELDYEGVVFEKLTTIDTLGTPQERTALSQREEQIADVYNQAVRTVMRFGAMVKAVNSRLQKGAPSANMDGAAFMSSLHNTASFIYTAIKAETVANAAVAELRAGRAPVVTLYNTNQALLTEIGLNQAADVGRYLTRIAERAVAIVMPDGSTASILTPAGYGWLVALVKEQEAAPLRDAADALVRQSESAAAYLREQNLPASPIDRVREIVENAGYQFGEVTGRTLMVRNGVVTRRAKPNPDTIIRQFNHGDTDGAPNMVLLLNSSGSTGLSAHASRDFRNQAQRVMFVLQPSWDINEMMQMFGRVNRKNQVSKPTYHLVFTSAAGEQRNAAILMSKLRSLSANTSGVSKAGYGETVEDALDFMNAFGDRALAELTKERNPVVASINALRPSTAIRAATSISQFLPVREQEQFISQIQAKVAALQDNAREAGLHDLEAGDIGRVSLTTEQLLSNSAMRAYEVRVVGKTKILTAAEALATAKAWTEKHPTLLDEAREKIAAVVSATQNPWLQRIYGDTAQVLEHAVDSIGQVYWVPNEVGGGRRWFIPMEVHLPASGTMQTASDWRVKVSFNTIRGVTTIPLSIFADRLLSNASLSSARNYNDTLTRKEDRTLIAGDVAQALIGNIVSSGASGASQIVRARPLDGNFASFVLMMPRGISVSNAKKIASSKLVPLTDIKQISADARGAAGMVQIDAGRVTVQTVFDRYAEVNGAVFGFRMATPNKARSKELSVAQLMRAAGLPLLGTAPNSKGYVESAFIGTTEANKVLAALAALSPYLQATQIVSDEAAVGGADTAPDNNAPRYRLVDDTDLLAQLEQGETFKAFRAMQVIDGKLYPPMSAKVGGKLRTPVALGKWEQTVEQPELVDAEGMFRLDKGNGDSLKARYNPYIHTSSSPLNDQFTGAYNRPNLVVVEVEVPVSELTSGYRADKAKDTVGEVDWSSGTVNAKLPKDRKRRVVLTRYDKPVRIVPDSEVAAHIAGLLKGVDTVIPERVVTPSLRAELRKLGVPVGTMAPRFRLAEPVFFSQLRRTLEAKMPNRMTVVALRGMIDPSKGSGIKADEIEWTGLREFMDSKNPGDYVTKAEVLDAVKDVEIQEVVKGEEYASGLSADEEARMNILLNLGSGNRTSEEEFELANLREQVQTGLANHDTVRTKFSQYQLPGGENYRELLLTLPAAPLYEVFSDGEWRSFASLEDANVFKNQHLSDPNVRIRKTEASKGDFRSDHFSEPNILAHVRFNERTAANGDKTLFLEEVQSDWHQKGRENGYAATEIGVKDDMAKRYFGKGYAELSPEDKSVVDETYKKPEMRGRRADGVPDAPFKDTSKGWARLAFKRMLRWAAENGFARIAWTTGEQQAERYDLSKKIERVSYNDLTGQLMAWEVGAYGDPGRLPVLRETVPIEKSADYIGKEAAQKLIASAPVNDVRSISGDDLRVGGEGMRTFYDQILPSIANDIGKKFGARAEDVTLGAEVDGYAILRDGVPVNEERYDTAEQAKVVMRQRGLVGDGYSTGYRDENVLAVHSLPVTESMRDSVMQGQPRFRLSDPVRVGELRTQSWIENNTENPGFPVLNHVRGGSRIIVPRNLIGAKKGEWDWFTEAGGLSAFNLAEQRAFFRHPKPGEKNHGNVDGLAGELGFPDAAAFIEAFLQEVERSRIMYAAQKGRQTARRNQLAAAAMWFKGKRSKKDIAEVMGKAVESVAQNLPPAEKDDLEKIGQQEGEEAVRDYILDRHFKRVIFDMEEQYAFLGGQEVEAPADILDEGTFARPEAINKDGDTAPTFQQTKARLEVLAATFHAPALAGMPTITDEAAADYVREALDAGGSEWLAGEAEKMIAERLTGQRESALNKYETAIMLWYQTHLDWQTRETDGQAAEAAAINDVANLKGIDMQRDRIHGATLDYLNAMRMYGSLAGQSLQALKLRVDHGFNIVKIYRQALEDNGDMPLTRAQYEKLKARVAALEKAWGEYVDAASTPDEEGDLAKRLAELEARLAALGTLTGTLKADAEALAKKRGELEAEYAKQSATATELSEKKAGLEAQIANLEQEIAFRAALNQDIAALQAKVDALTARIEALDAEYAGASPELLAALERQLADLNREYAAKRAAYEKAQADLKTAQERLKRVQKMIEKLGKTVKAKIARRRVILNEAANLYGVFKSEMEKAQVERLAARWRGANPAGKATIAMSVTRDLIRALQSMGDESVAGRQLAKLGLAHPVLWARAFAQSQQLVFIRGGARGQDGQLLNWAERSDRALFEVDQLMREHPMFDVLVRKGGLSWMDLTADPQSFDEQQTPVGPILRTMLPSRFTRAYTSLLAVSNNHYAGMSNMLRFAAACQLYEKLNVAKGETPSETDVYAIVSTVDIFGGRGDAQSKRAKEFLGVAGHFLYSPRLALSNVQFFRRMAGLAIYPQYSGQARAMMATEYLRLGATYATISILARLVSKLFSDDPDEQRFQFRPGHSAFLTLMFGQRRLDISGGAAMWARSISSILGFGDKLDIETGLTIKAQADRSNLDWMAVGRLVRSKLDPWTGMLTDVIAGKTYSGQAAGPRAKPNFPDYAMRYPHMLSGVTPVPLSFQSFVELLRGDVEQGTAPLRNPLLILDSMGAQFLGTGASSLPVNSELAQEVAEGRTRRADELESLNGKRDRILRDKKMSPELKEIRAERIQNRIDRLRGL